LVIVGDSAGIRISIGMSPPPPPLDQR